MKHMPHPAPALQITNEDENEDDPSEAEVDPLSALVLQSQFQQGDITKLPSVKPADSLALVPQKLENSQSILYLTINRPSVVSLKSVVDKRGDRFHITPHKEAIIIECPIGGQFVEEYDTEKFARKGDHRQPAELRCVGDEEVVKFQARGVGALKVGWRKKSKDSTQSGVIEGIEDEVEPVEQLALVRRDRMSKTHFVPLRVVHDQPGVHTVSLTGVTDSLHNTYHPTGHSAEKVYNVIGRPSARLDCSGPREILVGKTTTLPVILDGSGNGALTDPLEVFYSFESPSSEVTTSSMKVSKRTESIVASEPGTYTLLEIRGPCSGSIMEPSSCKVQLVPPPTVDMQVTTLHEW